MLMKKLLPILVTTSCAFSSYAQEYRFIAKDSNLATELCVEAANNHKSGIKQVMRKLYGNSYSAHAVNTITCNDLSLSQFSLRYGAIDTFRYLNRISYGKNKVKASTSITDVVLLPSDEIKAPISVYVLAKR